MPHMIFLANLAATLMMTGLIWFIQIVHYPLFAKVGEPGFALYAQAHSQLTTWVVFPLMTIELLTAVLMLIQRPASITAQTAWIGLILVVVIWGATGLLSVPQHNILVDGFDAGAQQKLVATNWVRTIAWSLRSGLVLWWAAITLKY